MMTAEKVVLFRAVWSRVPAILFLLLYSAGGVFVGSIPTMSAAASTNAWDKSPYPTLLCIDFDDLTPGATYSPGDIFVDSGSVITAQPFTWTNGTVYTNGLATVGGIGLAGGSGLEVNLNNISLDIDFAQPLTGLSFAFGEYGGNLNLEVNGDFRNFENFIHVNGQTVGGAVVQVLNGLGNDIGLVRLSGSIQSFSIGGQELWIDDLCPEGGCIDFEDLTLSDMYTVGDTFIDAGVPIEGEVFIWGDGSVYIGGIATVLNQGLAGGTGLEMVLDNISLKFDFEENLPGLSLDFGEYGGNLNLNINGEFRNFDNFADLHLQVVGGVQVVVINGLGNDIGRLYLFGEIDTFSIGGQELWLDNLCPESCCVDFESLPPGASYQVGATFSDSGAAIEAESFVWINGTVFSGGEAQVSAMGLAGGSYQEIYLNNINLRIDFGMPLRGLSLLFGEYGGNLNLEINGDFRNFQNFSELDGLTVGGVTVSVVNGLGNDIGRMELEGLIHRISIGGQELAVDDICPTAAEQVFLPAMRNSDS